jgi:serine/threonine-protein kinase
MDRLEVTGDPAPFVEGIGSSTTGTVEMDVSSDGTLVYRGAGGSGLLTVQWMDSAGRLQPLVGRPALYGRPSLSPQGDRLAIEIGTDVWIYDPRRDTMSRLIIGGVSNLAPLWSPDGRYIVYQDPGGISWVRSDGATPQTLIRSKHAQWPWSFTGDGKRLAYLEAGTGGFDLWTVSLEGDPVSGIRAGKPEVFLNSQGDERSPSFSPDGRWMAYSSNEAGTFEIYVRAFPDKGVKWQISNGGGNYPRWSLTKPELLFETLDAHIMVATYSIKDGSFVPDKPRLWSPKPIVNMVNSVKNFDLAPDGKRIVALMPFETPENPIVQSRVTFLLNFPDELKRRVGRQ